MRKAITLALALAFITPAHANEIPGTRVKGQNAECAPGQGRALEINATTQEEWTYCFELAPPPPPPTQAQLEEKLKENLAQNITQKKNADAPTVRAEQVIEIAPTPITETLTKIEVNATTQVTTISELTEEEKAQAAKDRASWQASQAAKTQAEEKAKAEPGVKQCVAWRGGGNQGEECAFEPIPATEEEVEQGFDYLKELLTAQWLSFLNLWTQWWWM